jgi:hypothetical protein
LTLLNGCFIFLLVFLEEPANGKKDKRRGAEGNEENYESSEETN